MKDDLFGFITRITEDPEANLRLALYPVTKAKYKKAPVYDRNNKLIRSEQEEKNELFINEEPECILTLEEFLELIRLRTKDSEEKEYIGENTSDDSSP